MDKMNNDHQEMRERIENEAWDEIDILKDKNKEELAKHIDAGMESKCNLTMINNEYRAKKNEKETALRQIEEKSAELKALSKTTSNLKQQIDS